MHIQTYYKLKPHEVDYLFFYLRMQAIHVVHSLGQLNAYIIPLTLIKTNIFLHATYLHIIYFSSIQLSTSPIFNHQIENKLCQLNLDFPQWDQLNLPYFYRRLHILCVLYDFIYTTIILKIFHPQHAGFLSSIYRN